MEIKKFTFGRDFQIDLLKMCIDSVSFMLLCKNLVKPDYFTDERVKRFIEFSYQYFDKYKVLPDKTYFKEISKDRTDRIYVKRVFATRTIRETFIREKVEEFIKKSMFIDYYISSGKIYNNNPNKPDKAYDLMIEGMKKISLINMQEDKYIHFYKDFNKRILEREHRIASGKTFKVRTGIKEFDIATRGGIGGGEVWMLLGDAKSGKSTGLIHFGVQAVKRFVPVMHFQLEGKIEETTDRYDSAYMGLKYDDVVNAQIPEEMLQKINRISSKRKKTDLIIKNYVDWDSCTILDIERDYLEVLNKGIRPKLVIIDYMDLMKSRKTIQGENSERHRQQSIIRDIKTFATKYNVAVWTATQANRGDEETRNDPNFVLTSKNLSEDYGKVRAIDGLLTINATNEEYKKGIARLWIDSARTHRAKRKITIRRLLDRSIFYLPKTKYRKYAFDPDEDLDKIFEKKKKKSV